MTATDIIDYRPHGSALAAWYAQEPEVLLSGPAGTGKSRAALEKLYFLAEKKYPGMRALIARKTRASLSTTALVTWEQFVLPPDHPAHPNVTGAHRAHRQSYRFDNGSEVDIGGLDKPGKIMSSEYDFVFVQEAIELTTEDWEALTTRLRNGRVPYQQIVGDTNPGSPSHWLKKRCDAGRCRLIHTRHEDNPTIYDQGRGTWTPQGERYIAKLDNLTGARLQRLRHGRWVQAEGAVYEDWDPQVHVVDRYKPEGGEWYLAVDFGTTNPFVCSLWHVDGDGRMVLVREIYRTRRAVVDHCRDIRAMLAWAGLTPADVERAVCDHDVDGRDTLERELGITVTAADKAVAAGIQEVTERLKVQADGRPRLTVMRDAVWEVDPDLRDASKPTCTADEMDGYVWSDKYIREQPVKENDHGCLVAGTMVTTAHGDVPIEDITAGDLVLTRAGFRPVLVAGLTDPAAMVFDLTTSDGTTLRGTGNHPVYIHGEGFIRMDALRYNAMLHSIHGSVGWTSSRCQAPSGLNGSDSSGSFTADIRSPRTSLTGPTFGPARAMWPMGVATFTGTFGLPTTVPSPMGTRSTTGMETHSITPSRISNYSQMLNTSRSTGRAGGNSPAGGRLPWPRTSGRPCSGPRPSGTAVPKEGNGTAGTPSGSPWGFPWSTGRVSDVARSTELRPMPSGPGTVRASAGPMPGRNPASMTPRGSVLDAASSSSSTGMRSRGSAACRVAGVTVVAGRHPVYNLKVDGSSEFFANGVLVHNCDAMRYLARWLAGRAVVTVLTTRR